jgi:hypothetical protein
MIDFDWTDHESVQREVSRLDKESTTLLLEHGIPRKCQRDLLDSGWDCRPFIPDNNVDRVLYFGNDPRALTLVDSFRSIGVPAQVFDR